MGIISLIHDVTHGRDETPQEMIDIVRSDKEMMLCHQKEHIFLTQHLAEFKSRTEVVTGAGGNPGKHPEAVNLVRIEQGLEVYSLSKEE